VGAVKGGVGTEADAETPQEAARLRKGGAHPGVGGTRARPGERITSRVPTGPRKDAGPLER